jgi:integrase/recombinase XerD
MLKLYRRHLKACKHKAKGRQFGRCGCPIWIQGTLAGEAIRKSLDADTWEKAEDLKRALEEGRNPNRQPTSFEQASAKFIADLEAQKSAPDTIRKYRLLFSQLKKHGDLLRDFTFDVLLSVRGEWTESAATNNKRLDRLKAFFRFCHDAGWIPNNPAKLIKPAKSYEPMVKPFTPDEQDFLLSKPQTRLLRTFVQTLYHSGLRISDCCMLRPQDFDKNRIRRVNQKNKNTVFIPLPPDLKAELDKLPLNGGYYFLQGESEKHYTQTDAWRTILNDAYKAEMPGFHAHRFRHTAAVNWLAQGLTMEEVAALLGNSVKVVERHYASFAPVRQQALEAKLAKTWEVAKPKLVRVK